MIMTKTGDPSIHVILGTQYGQRVVLPHCDRSKLFCDMANTKTITPRLIDLIKKLGFRVEVVPTEPKEL